jgi:4a-hydroxytetrahydrobiopterin dehydratase
MGPQDVAEYLKALGGWQAEENKKIKKEFVFKDFVSAIAFVNRVAAVAEGEGHHPALFISYNKVKVTLSTHAIGGLSENDFILAAKIDERVRT